MKYMRTIMGYTGTDNKANTEITKELQFWTKYRTTEGIGCNM
jgi:hypothetical protein